VATTEADETTRTRAVRENQEVPTARAPETASAYGWEPTRTSPDMGDEESLFRFPAADDPSPGTRRLLTMSAYASLLGLGGLGIGVRGLVSQVGGGVPIWYAYVLASLGLVSVALAVGAFLSIHRRTLPWVLLVSAAVPLAADIMLAVAY
jgi:hypothetical protein